MNKNFKFNYNTNNTKNQIIFISIIFVILTLMLFVIVNKRPISLTMNNPLSHQSRTIDIGFWEEGFYNKDTIYPEKLKTIEQEINKKIIIANYYRGWELLDQQEIVKELNTISSYGWTPMLSSNPYFFKNCPANGMTLYHAISTGDCDAFLHRVGKTLSKVNKPFYFRFAWEMNVDTMQWSTIQTGSTPQDFINAWRRFHNIIEEEGAKNVIWVFSPQVETPKAPKIASLYPGNDFIDWVALDGYNWGTTQSWSKWQDFYSIFHQSYNEITSVAPGKKLMIAETNTTNVGGNQAQWYKNMLSDEIPNDFPDIYAIVFFNDDKSSTEGVKWLIDNSIESLNQFRESMQNPIYR